MEFNGKFRRTVRKLLRTNSVDAVAAELCARFRLTDDEAYEAIEYVRA